MPVGRPDAPVLPDDPEHIEKWRKLLDEKRTSRKVFCEFFKVPTKKPGLFKGSTLVKFKAYPLQTLIRETVEWQWEAGRGAKIIGGKGRQEGLTVGAALLFWERFVRGGGGTWNIFSYDDDAVRELFRLFLSFKRQMPDWVFGCLVRGGGRWKKRSAKQLEIEFDDGEQNAMLQCLTAGGKHSGSGSSPRGLLFDEFSKWTEEAKADWSSMSEGWADAPGNLWIIQATGQGQEGFAERFSAAWEGSEEAKESGFVAVFRSWLGHPDRTIEMTAEEASKFAKVVGTNQKFGIAEEKALVAAGATLGELKWRRMKIAEMNWNLLLFAREYPLTPGDMFIVWSTTIFADQLPVLRSYIVAARERDRFAKRGNLDDISGETFFKEDPSGPWIIYEEPRADTYYCFGADSTSGKKVASSGSGELDFAVGTFDELWSGKTVAIYRAHTEGRVFGRELFNAACWYKGKDKTGSYGFIENNSIGVVTINEMRDMERGAIGGEDLLLKMNKKMSSTSGGWGDIDFGFAKFKESTEMLIQWLREYLDEVPVFVPGGDVVLSHLFVTEALKFVRSEAGKPGAQTGHDDGVVSKGFALAARREIFRMGLVESSTKVQIHVAEDPIMQFYAAQRAKRQSKQTRVLGMGLGF